MRENKHGGHLGEEGTDEAQEEEDCREAGNSLLLSAEVEADAVARRHHTPDGEDDDKDVFISRKHVLVCGGEDADCAQMLLADDHEQEGGLYHVMNCLVRLKSSYFCLLLLNVYLVFVNFQASFAQRFPGV